MRWQSWVGILRSKFIFTFGWFYPIKIQSQHLSCNNLFCTLSFNLVKCTSYMVYLFIDCIQSWRTCDKSHVKFKEYTLSFHALVIYLVSRIGEFLYICVVTFLNPFLTQFHSFYFASRDQFLKLTFFVIIVFT